MKLKFFLRSRALLVAAIVLLPLVAACSKSEERSEMHLQKALQLIAEGNDLDARLELLNSVKYNAGNVNAFRALAGVNERVGSTSSYFQNLSRVIALDPNDNDAKIRLAKLLLRGNAVDAALRMMESVTGQENNADFHGTKANIFVATKDMSAALAEARKAAEIDPTNVDAALILASERAGRNEFQEALQVLNRAKVTDPKDHRVALSKVQLLQRTGNLPQAEAELRALTERNPKDAVVRTQLAQVLAQQRKMEDAEKELRVMADANPADSKPALDLIRFIMATRGAAAARQELEARISKGGEVFPYQIAMADLAIGQRNLAEAATILDKLTTDAKSADNKNTAKVKLAEIKASQKDVAGAERLVADVLAGDRRNVGALRLRAAIALDRGETDAAITDLREALNEQPKATEILLLMGQAYERNGQKELAERQYAEAARAGQYSPPIVLRYVAYLQRDGNAARAEEILIESFKRNPQSVDLLSSLAQVRLSRKNWTGALEIADAMVRNEPTKALGDQIRAAALAGQNKPDESIAALEQAHAASPNALLPIASLVRSYSAQKSYDKAEQLLKDMLAKFPNSAQLLVLRGQVELAKGAPSEAAKSFESAIGQQPKDAVGYSALADFYIRKKQLDQAIATIDRGLDELPTDINLRMAKAGLMDSKGQPEASIALYESILKDQPGSLVAVNNLASMLLDHRSDKESLDRAQALVDRLRGAQTPQFLDTVGWALHLRGDHGAAKPLLEQAKLQLPDVAVVRFHLGMIYRALGDEPKAAEELRAASTLETDETTLKKKIQAALN